MGILENIAEQKHRNKNAQFIEDSLHEDTIEVKKGFFFSLLNKRDVEESAFRKKVLIGFFASIITIGGITTLFFYTKMEAWYQANILQALLQKEIAQNIELKKQIPKGILLPRSQNKSAIS